MNERIRKHVEAFIGTPSTDEEIIEAITEERVIGTELVSEHRWWNIELRVVEINGMLIGFNWGVTTGDDSARDKGWEFDPDSICEVEEYEVTTKAYREKAEP